MTRRGATRPEVRVGGHWLSSIVPHGWGGLRHSTRPTGAWEASWSIPVVGHWRHPALVYGARVELQLGPVRLFAGTLEEPDWDSGQFVALGACRDAEDALAFDGALAATTKPNVALDAAIGRGVLSWTRVGDFGATAVGATDDAGGLVTIQSVLDTWADENDSGWRVDEHRRVDLTTVDESTVDWFVVPGAGVLGSAADKRVDCVYVRYNSSTTGRTETAFYPPTIPPSGTEDPADITDRRAMTAAEATAVAESMWSDLRGRSGWTNGITLSHGQILTPGGVLADPALVEANDTMCLLGVPDPRGLAMNLTVVIGETEYDWTEDQVQLNPVGRAARDEESALEEVGNLAVDAMRAATANRNGDTGWVGLTSAVAGVSVAYRTRAGVCSVRATGTATSLATGYVTLVAPGGLPTSARPAFNAWGGGLIAAWPGGIGANTDGSITIRQESGGSRSGAVSATYTYPIG